MFTNEKREGINRFVCDVSLYVAETPKASIKYHKPPLPIIPFGIVAYGFVGRFSKQLYKDAETHSLCTLEEFITYRRLHLPVNALAQNMFSCDVKRQSFRCQTSSEVYFSTLLKGKMILIKKKGRNYQRGVPLSTICRIK